MADLRQYPAIIDDFERAVENPLSFGGQWARTDSVWSQGLRTKQATGTKVAVEPLTGTTFGSSYWIPDSWDGDDAEFWGHAVGGNYPGIHWEVGLVSSAGGSNAVDGYAFRRSVTTAGGSTQMKKITNGTYANLTALVGGAVTSGQWMLIRRNGSLVEGWMSPDTVTWTLRHSVSDSTYTTGLHGSIDLADNARLAAHGWDDVGGGPRPTINTPEFIRRPWRYQGQRIDRQNV